MYEKQKAALESVCAALENAKNIDGNSVVHSVSIDNCIGDIRHCISTLEELERVYYDFSPGPDLKRPQCDIDGTCGNAINDTGCHERWTCL